MTGIHDGNHVEVFEIVRRQSPGAQWGQVVTPLRAGAHRAGIGGFARVVIVGGGRIHPHFIGQTGLCQAGAQHAFCGG